MLALPGDIKNVKKGGRNKIKFWRPKKLRAGSRNRREDNDAPIEEPPAARWGTMARGEGEGRRRGLPDSLRRSAFSAIDLIVPGGKRS